MNPSHYEHLIIGAGFAGLGMGIQLKEAGLNDFLILERDAQLGGTWFVNNYPGAACDVQSHLYCFSFEQNAEWSRTFGPQEEILSYMEHCAEKHKLHPHFRFNTNVTEATFDEEQGMWNLQTSASNYRCRYLISCSGGLSQPAFPDIVGFENFKGVKFHSAQWNHQVDLTGKKVAVIGTGASAIQIVPSIAPRVKELQLYQRTPPWILPKPDRQMRTWERKLFRTMPSFMHLYRRSLYWRNELFATGFIKQPAIMKLARMKAMGHIKKSVTVPELRKTVTPNYTVGCKRVLLSNDYYPALCRDNVKVITTSIERMSASGIITSDGEEHPCDVIILATGFNAAEGLTPFPIKGRSDLDLNTAWSGGAEAYLGTSISGFPNLFLIVGPNTGLGHSSMILMIESQIHYIMEAYKAAKAKEAKFIDVKKSVQENYNRNLQEQLSRTVWQTGGCQSWYQNKQGKNVTLWPGFTFTFRKMTRKFEPEKYEFIT